MKVDEINVIAGLEDAFYSALQTITHGSQLSLRGINQEYSRRRYVLQGARSVLRSLFASYKLLNSDRKQAWGDYGAGLSMSGRSAYAQYNYPRLLANLLPERFPPVYVGNKVKNFDMFGNPPQYWTLGSAGVFYGNGHASVIEDDYVSDTLVCYQNLTLLPNTDYEVAFEFHTYDNDGGKIKFGLGIDLDVFNADDYNYEGQRVSTIIHTPSGSGLLTLPVIFYARDHVFPTYINNVSVIEV